MASNNLNQKYSEQASSSKTFLIQKGQLNKYRLRPAILNEHVETSREIQGVVAAGNIVGQIFNVCEDNINGIGLTLESAAGIVFDNFESYADSAALQAAWVASTARLPTLEETIVAPDSTKSFRAPTTTVADEWIKTISATDYTDFTGLAKVRQTNNYISQKVRFFIGDGVNTKSAAVIAPTDDEWFDFEINEADLTEDGGGTTDPTAITKVGYRVESAHPGSFLYLDDLIAVPPPGSVKLKLFDMGTDIPVDGVTALDDGTQYTTFGDIGFSGSGNGVVSEIEVDLVGGKREYSVSDFIAGVAKEIPGNETLNPCHFYALTIEYVDTDVNVWGSDASFEINYYQNGYAFESPDEATAISKIGEFNDIQFLIFSTQPVFINSLTKTYDAAPGKNSIENIKVKDDNKKVIGVITKGAQALQLLEIEFKDRFFFMPKGGQVKVDHNDDFSDNTSQVNLVFGYIFEPPKVNG